MVEYSHNVLAMIKLSKENVSRTPSLTILMLRLLSFKSQEHNDF